MHNARVQKTVKGGPKCVLNPLVAEGGRDVCLATGFSQIHTGLQMAKIFRQFHKQGYHVLTHCERRVVTGIYSGNTQVKAQEKIACLSLFQNMDVLEFVHVLLLLQEKCVCIKKNVSRDRTAMAGKICYCYKNVIEMLGLVYKLSFN